MLRMERISHSFLELAKPKPVLLDVTLDIVPEQTLCIVGPSGCGKTTLLQILTGKLPPQKGQVVWHSNAALADGRPQLAYMAQDDQPIPFRTTLQNAVLPAEVRGALDQSTISDASKLLTEVGLDTFQDYLPSQLSGGMRRRCLMAMHLLTRKAFYVFDEPFAALDHRTADQMSDVLYDFRQRTGATFVLVLHDIEAAAAIADCVCVLSDRPSRILAQYRPRPELASLSPAQRRRHPLFDDLVLSILRSLGSSRTTADKPDTIGQP